MHARCSRRSGAAFVYSLKSGRSHQITDGSGVGGVEFDKGGKHSLSPPARTPARTFWQHVCFLNRSRAAKRLCRRLQCDDPSPLLPGERRRKGCPQAAEKSADADKAKKEAPTVKIDLENIDQRILALPLPSQNYAGILAGKPGIIFLTEGEKLNAARRGPPPGLTVRKYDLNKRKAEKFAENVNDLAISLDGEKLLYRQGPDKWFLVPAAAAPKPGDGALKIDELEVKIDPRAEWEQIFNETWRIERDFLYDPKAHGLDLLAAKSKYQSYLPGLGSRYDPFDLLMEEMLWRIVSRSRIRFADRPPPPDLKTGLALADYSIEHDRYKFAKIYRGEAWNPDLRSPLLQPKPVLATANI